MRSDGKAHHPLLLLSFLAVLVLPSHAQSNSSRPGTDDNSNYCSSNGRSVYPCLGFTCSADRSIYPCRAYALYRASTGDNLTSVGDLFGVSPLSIARASNLSANSTAGLRSGQPLLIPLLCSCAENHSYALVDYQIGGDDTYYIVSTTKLQNLTVFPAVELVNPTLVPTDLTVGVITVFPIFCQCPNRTNLLINTNTTTNLSMVSYVFRPSDSYSSIASNFGTDVQSLISLNGPENLIEAFSVILIPVTQMPPPLLANTSSAPSPSPSSTPPATSAVVKKETRKGVIAGLAAGMGLFAILLALVLVLYSRERKKARREGAKAHAGGWNKEGGGGRRFGWSGTDEKLMTGISEWLDKYKIYQIEELRMATSDFDDSCLIQGTMYKGIIDGELFAVKKMKWNACDELKILQKVNHTNLVKLEGFCIDPEEGSCYLVYEYVENGSLHSWLHGPSSPTRRLDWRSRLRIALDLAQGLQYIHEHTWPRVVHKDIKSSNVLLDSKLRAKIANFGLAKSGINAVTTHIVGTQGYIAPEYLSDGLVTTKMDVFAYGVVLLELISGKEAVSEEGEALWVEAEVVFERREASVAAWMDPVLRQQSCPVESVVSVLNVARACLQRDPAKRPTMVDVAYVLSKADELFSDYSGDRLSVGSEDAMVMAR